MVAQRVSKLLVSCAFLLLLIVATVKYNGARVTVPIESYCGNYPNTICVQCLHIPNQIHQASFYTSLESEKQRLAVFSCLNYTCSQMLQLIDGSNFEFDKSELPQLFMAELAARPSTDSHQPLKDAHSWVVYTTGSNQNIPQHSSLQFNTEDLGTIAFLGAIGALLVVVYVSIVVKQFNIPFVRVLLECIVLVGLVLHYSTSYVLSNNSVLVAVHVVFVFVLLLAAKTQLYVAIIGGVLSYLSWNLNRDTFPALVSIVALNGLVQCSKSSSKEDLIGEKERLAKGIVVCYSMVRAGVIVEPGFASFELYSILLVCWTISILHVYSIDNLNFEIYEKQGNKLQQEQNIEIDEEANSSAI